MSKNPIIEFFVISDIQLTVNNKKSHEKLKFALQDIHAINPNPDAIIINGDLISDGRSESYLKLKEILESNAYAKRTFFTIGNHEYFLNDGNQPSIERFLSFANLDQVYYKQVLEDYAFIFLGTESWGPIGAPTKDSAVLSEAQLAWLESALEEHRGSEKPVFVFLHQPIPNTIPATDLEYYQNGIIQSKELIDILSQYPQAIYFSGHSHWDLSLPGTYLRKVFSMVNTGAIYDTYGIGDNGEETVVNAEGSQGLYVQLYKNKVVIKGRDFSKKGWIDLADIAFNGEKELSC
ncbi:metallophosphoesterase family protein [Lederbergia lenta]|uniref:Metallophosphoesterase n=1 Tax=Lederbergia lenta TaxID=1467 RepID=A0A2X4W4G5_LEDLE|nr:metallophosphoesterase [Lederbergia lenta]MCM3110873.1 metallophosphoesterase [Lederbergia lenta]MEC2325731.1 metallophosphoesterase [Lederbergia lenta]SQI53842.1 metallophosphoesterase [Lederbergia lenta]